jgi:aspartate/tyrosine/aromatic aminotransferase
LFKYLDNYYFNTQGGDPQFVQLAMKFAFGDDSLPLQEQRLGGVQTLSGTGGLRVMGELLRSHGHSHIYIPNPTWGNHGPIFRNSGLEVRTYAYYDVATSSLSFDQLLKDMSQMPLGSCVLLHACAHNPTGMDPTLEQWHQISDMCHQRQLLPFFDCAYQGFASGNAPQDAAAIRLFVEHGHSLALVQSFSKNFGLYGQRVGALSVVASSPDEAKRVESQMKLIIRPMVRTINTWIIPYKDKYIS